MLTLNIANRNICMKSVLITGGTGSFGKAFVKELLTWHKGKIIIYSRDEQKQEEMANEFKLLDEHGVLRFFIGDVRDKDRLQSAMSQVDTVIHAAALKIVPKCEYDPIEAVKTNIYGAENVIKAAIDCCVSRVIALSTDKAVSPVNLYGATKLTAERLFIAANHLSGSVGNNNLTKFSIVRYGNVANSRGSVIPLFKKLSKMGKPLSITHPEMTRFWITLEQAVAFVVENLHEMQGGEIFIPKMPSFRITELADAICYPEEITLSGIPIRFDHPIVGMRPGEKVHETLITTHDTPHLTILDNSFIINPEWRSNNNELNDFTYSSDTNDNFLTYHQLSELVK